MNNDYPGLKTELQGLYQLKNTRTILTALPLLKEAGYHIDERNVRNGFARVCELTGLMGRWQKLQESPTLICDTGHNVGGITYIVEQLKQQTYRQLHIIIGMVNDKDISGVLALLPKDAVYYFTKASVKRASGRGAVQARCQSRLAGKLLSGCSRRRNRRTRKKPPRRFYLRRWQQLYRGRFISEPRCTQSPLRPLSEAPLRQQPNARESLPQNKWHILYSCRQTKTYPPGKR